MENEEFKRYNELADEHTRALGKYVALLGYNLSDGQQHGKIKRQLENDINETCLGKETQGCPPFDYYAANEMFFNQMAIAVDCDVLFEDYTYETFQKDMKTALWGSSKLTDARKKFLDALCERAKKEKDNTTFYRIKALFDKGNELHGDYKRQFYSACAENEMFGVDFVKNNNLSACDLTKEASLTVVRNVENVEENVDVLLRMYMSNEKIIYDNKEVVDAKLSTNIRALEYLYPYDDKLYKLRNEWLANVDAKALRVAGVTLDEYKAVMARCNVQGSDYMVDKYAQTYRLGEDQVTDRFNEYKKVMNAWLDCEVLKNKNEENGERKDLIASHVYAQVLNLAVFEVKTKNRAKDREQQFITDVNEKLKEIGVDSVDNFKDALIAYADMKKELLEKKCERFVEKALADKLGNETVVEADKEVVEDKKPSVLKQIFAKKKLATEREQKEKEEKEAREKAEEVAKARAVEKDKIRMAVEDAFYEKIAVDTYNKLVAIEKNIGSVAYHDDTFSNACNRMYNYCQNNRYLKRDQNNPSNERKICKERDGIGDKILFNLSERHSFGTKSVEDKFSRNGTREVPVGVREAAMRKMKNVR